MTSAAAPRVDRAPFGTMPDAWRSSASPCAVRTVQASVITYGGAAVADNARPRRAERGCRVRHDELESYLAARRFFGAIIGRYANRIARARCMLDGTELRLDANNGANHAPWRP